MKRTISQVAKILGVNASQVKAWACIFKEYLSQEANPQKGRVRSFSDLDLLVFALVCEQWESDPDVETIKIGLNQGEHRDERFIKHLYLHTPLLQEPPDNLDETWRHGVLLNGGGINEYLELARNYRESAYVLLNSALKSGEPCDWTYPVLFAFRHTLELYLKIIGEIDEPTHSLQKCIRVIENRYGKRSGSPIREWICEFDKIDPKGTTFRYADDEMNTLYCAEYWIDFVQFKFAMSQVFKMLDAAILRVGAKGKPSKRPKLARQRRAASN